MLARRVSAPLHALPDFVVLGAMKSGTSALYAHLTGHPQVVPAMTKEVRYFDLNYHRGESWYRSHFPLAAHLAARRRRGAAITGEPTPYYLFHPHAPARAAATIPDARLVVLLRDPVTRAYSHYQHEVRKGREHLTFEQALDAEGERVGRAAQRLAEDPTSRAPDHQRFSYVARGRYARQLEAWRRHFPAEQILVIVSEELFENPGSVYDRLTEHLAIEPWRPGRFVAVGRRDYPSMPAGCRERLRDAFRADNAELEELLGREISWAREP